MVKDKVRLIVFVAFCAVLAMVTSVFLFRNYERRVTEEKALEARYTKALEDYEHAMAESDIDLLETAEHNLKDIKKSMLTRKVGFNYS